MRNLMWMMALPALLWSACDHDGDGSDSNMEAISGSDLTFVNQATYIHRGGVEIGALAGERSETASVVDYGAMMVKEHQHALDELEEIVDDYANDLPNDLDEEHQDLKDTLMGLSGAMFDSVYISNVVKGHAKAIALFESQSSNGNVKSVRDFANKHLPHIRAHHDTADSLYNVLEADQPEGNSN